MDFEVKNFGYSLKNIPIPSRKSYMKCLISKVESLIRKMRWKAFFYDKGKNGDSHNYGFKTRYSPPQNEYLSAFEDDLIALVRNIQFKPVRDKFLTQLKNDMREICKSENVLVFADKSTNLYSVKKETYDKILTKNITKSYKRVSDDVAKNINKEAKLIAHDLKLEEKMECYAQRNAFVTFKDHKDNFPHNVKCRLLNPAKSEVGIVSKKILERINNDIRAQSESLQWRNTSSVITWFNNINNKSGCKFIKFDIVDFYPSISNQLLDNSLKFAMEKTNVTSKEIDIIQHSRKSLLFNNNGTWIRKGSSSLFDVTQGSYDGAEICELVGLYILGSLSYRFGNSNIGLYRDDGLGVLRNLSGPQTERARKDLIRIFKDHGLKITAETNLWITDFLDVTFDLSTGKYRPYRKPNNTPLYINKRSNHPPSIIKQLPIMINRRISEISSSKEEFDVAKPQYEDALFRSGHGKNMEYCDFTRTDNNTKRNRKRNVIWFNPPYNQNVKSNIGKSFLNLIKKHFPPHHKFRPIFNKNNIKISYSCMPNIGDIIKGHNSKIIKSNSQKQQNEPKSCNCRNQKLCPLSGFCLESDIVYKATVSSPNAVKYYYGLSASQFKLRYNNHTSSFRNQNQETDTELSKYIWHLKDRNKQFQIAWSIVARAPSYKCGARKCDLCLTEKLIIAQADQDSLLNKRTEIVSTCRHRNKFLLYKVK